MTKAETGRWGEDTAAGFLLQRGYSIIERNYHSRFGEIDIIAADEKYVCFVEVRTRAEGAMISGLESVDIRKARKIFRTACIWLDQKRCSLQPRFDIISIKAAKCTPPAAKSIDHITNAFGAEVCNEIF